MATNIRIEYKVIRGELVKAKKDVEELSKQNKLLQNNVNGLENQYKKLDAQVKKSNSGFAGMRGQLGQLGAAFGITSGIFLFAGALKNAAKTVVDFQKQNAILAGVLGKSRKDIKALTEDAKRLGGTTVKTASQVTGLQISLSRLGFSEQQIINLTGSLITGSIALNAELDETAELVGAMVRTFDEFTTLDADEILDKLTVATQKSALNFQKLQAALPIVGGAANAAGIPFSRLLALLGKLSDAGIDTSTSATSLRNIFIDAAGSGKNYADILADIAGASDSLTASTDEFGRRTAVSASIISNQIGAIDDLTEALEKSEGAAVKLAKEQEDTLAFSITKVASAYEGLILTLEDGEGAFGSLTTNILKLTSGALTLLTFDAEKITNLFGELTRAQLLYNEGVEKGTKIVKDNIKETSTLDEQISSLLATQNFYVDQLEESRKGMDAFTEAGKAGSIEANQLRTKIMGLEGTTSALAAALSGLNEKQDERSKKTTEEIGLLGKLKAELKEEVRLRSLALTEDEVLRRTRRVEQIKDEIDALTKLNKIKKEELFITERIESAQSFLRESARTLTKEQLVDGIKRVNLLSEENKNKTDGAIRFDQEEKQRKKAAREQAIEAGVQLGNFLFENKQNNLQREFDLLEFQKERDLERAGDNAEQRQIIEERYAKKAGELKTKQAKAEKAQALFSIAISTARGIMGALGSIPPNPALAIAIGVTGGIQAGAVLSQKIPKFRQGGAIGGHLHEQGGTMIEAEKGEYVLRREAVAKYGIPMLEELNNSSLNPNIVVMNDNKGIEDALKSRPENRLVWDERGFTAYQQRQNNTRVQKAKRYSV